jgi:hypothetical protein
MTRCKACGSDYRKGVLAFLLTPGGLKGARVCQSCASGGVLLVAPKLGPVVRKKEVRSDGVERALRQLRTLAGAAQAVSKKTFPPSTPLREIDDRLNVERFSGRAEGFESAIEVLRRECGS